jgi:hypothetical protein
VVPFFDGQTKASAVIVLAGVNETNSTERP